ncbi:uncharacterized protein LOC126954473 [Macaca thibetana thibetana]|uniref:uncharacterized protein LOC126954473 n=1 Tax=Macaca thibetana thibetana TaxID=257877 RepID=UPI0021BC6EFF|nr:uncharacterized protein LOC126954473 [Macaca thibetana thibetana]
MRRRDRRARAPSPARGAPPRTLVPPPPPHPARGPARLALAPPFPAPGSPRHPRDAPPPPPPRAGVPGRVSPPSFPIRAPIRRGPLRKRRSPPPARSPGPPGPHPQRSPPLGAPASALPSLPSLSTGSGPHFPPTRLPAAGKPVEVMGVQGVGERGARVLGWQKRDSDTWFLRKGGCHSYLRSSTGEVPDGLGTNKALPFHAWFSRIPEECARNVTTWSREGPAGQPWLCLLGQDVPHTVAP